MLRAAAIAGETISEFMDQAISDRAQRVIADHDRIVLSEKARETFLAALLNPPTANDRLVALVERYAAEVKNRP